MDTLTVGEVNEVLDRLAAAYSAKDVDALMSLTSDAPDTVIVGTGADEVRVGPTDIRQQLERDISQADQISLVLGSTRVSVHGDVAWVFAEPIVKVALGGQDMRMAMRMTLVLVKTGDKIVIRSGHLSVPFAGQESGQSFADA